MIIGLSREELSRCLCAYAGRRLIVRSRKRYLAQIDTVDLSEHGLGLSGTLLHSIDPESPHRPTAPLPRSFKWRATWDLIGGGQGLLIAHYVSWSLFYDEPINQAVAEAHDRLGNTEAFAHLAQSLIDTWQSNHRPKPPTEVGP